MFSPSAFTIVITAFSAIGGFLFGYNIFQFASLHRPSSFNKILLHKVCSSSLIFFFFLVLFDPSRYDTGVISGALILMKHQFHLSPSKQEVIVSMALAGAVVGSLSGGYVADKLGRRVAIGISSILFMIGSCILAGAFDFISLIVGRLIVGLGIGFASATVPVYVSEVCFFFCFVTSIH